MPDGLMAQDVNMLPSVTGAIAGLVAWAAVPLLAGAWRTMTRDAQSAARRYEATTRPVGGQQGQRGPFDAVSHRERKRGQVHPLLLHDPGGLVTRLPGGRGRGDCDHAPSVRYVAR
jgi:hypothetical protein